MTGNARLRMARRRAAHRNCVAVGLSLTVLVLGATVEAQDKSAVPPTATSRAEALQRAEKQLADADRERMEIEKQAEFFRNPDGTLRLPPDLGFQLVQAKESVGAAWAAVAMARAALGLPSSGVAERLQRGSSGDVTDRATSRLAGYQAEAQALSEKPCPRDRTGWEEYLSGVTTLLVGLVAASSLGEELKAKADADLDREVPITVADLLGEGYEDLKARREAIRKVSYDALARYEKSVEMREERQKRLDRLIAALSACWDSVRTLGGTAPGDYITKERILEGVTGEYGKKRIEMEWIGLPVGVKVMTIPCETCKTGTAPADRPKEGASPPSPSGGAPPK